MHRVKCVHMSTERLGRILETQNRLHKYDDSAHELHLDILKMYNNVPCQSIRNSFRARSGTQRHAFLLLGPRSWHGHLDYEFDL